MKQVINTLRVMTLTAILIGGFSMGCVKKPLLPPPGADVSNGGMAGKDINYPAADYPSAEGGYNENNLAIEGSLDDTAASNMEHLGSMAVDGNQGEQSDAYKQQHGRSSSGLLPVYFNFDQAGVRPDMTSRLVQNSEYLKQINAGVIVEGNCDDRGTNEYNLALGEKRAINIRDYLVNLGIAPTRIRTVSFGEERPLFLEQTEFAWEQNRRVDFVVE